MDASLPPDDKLLTKYGVGVSKWVKARAKRRGEAKVQYLRFAQTFVLLATACEHRLFHEEEGVIPARVESLLF